jgi:hypothetical protein
MVTDRMGPTITTLKAEVDFLGGELAAARAEIERLRAWNAEIALNARHFAEALREIAEHPTGGVGCNPEGFVRAARAALEG